MAKFNVQETSNLIIDKEKPEIFIIDKDGNEKELELEELFPELKEIK